MSNSLLEIPMTVLMTLTSPIPHEPQNTLPFPKT